MNRKNIMQRLDRLEPRIWYVEDLSESYIEVYGFQGIEEIILENGMEYIKGMLNNKSVPDFIKEKIKEYFKRISENEVI